MTSETRSLTLEDFWQLKSVSDVQVSPNGTTVAYVVGTYDERSNKSTSAIWVADLKTGAARQFTGGEPGDNQPAWSPDGSRLAFTSTRHDGKAQIYVMPADGGEPRRLTNAEDGATTPLWAPDGTRICYTSNVKSDRQKVAQETAWFEEHPAVDQNTPRLRVQDTLLSRMDMRGYVESRGHLFVIEVDAPDAQARQLTSGDFDVQSPAWSPDGEVIAYLANRTEDAEHSFVGDVWCVDLVSGEERLVTDSSLTAMGLSWSPDSQTLALYARPEWFSQGYRDTHLWTVSREDGSARDISSELDQNVGGGVQPDYAWSMNTGAVWSPDGGTLYFPAVDAGDEAIFAVSNQGGPVRRISSGDGCVGSMALTPDGTRLVVTASTPTQPIDVFTVSTAGGPLQQLTHTNQDLLSEVELAPTQKLHFIGPEGWEVEGRLVTPTRGQAPYPTILQVHGGPYGAWGNAFYFTSQALAGAGYATLFINPRGSFGQGERFTRAADWGLNDFGDLMAGVDHVVDLGLADPARLGVTGLSYGGFMTNWAVGHTDRFQAAVAVNGVSNFFSMYGVSDVTALWFQTEFGGPFWDDEERYQRYRFHSPISYVGNVSTPLLLLQSENDYRCPIDQGEQMLTALRMRRQKVRLVRFPGASHVIVATAPPHQRYLQWRLAKDWFDQYVLGRRADMPEQHSAEAVSGALSGLN